MDNAIEFMRMCIIFQMFLAVEVPLGILVILHNVSSSIIEFLDYNLVHTATLIINLLICLSYPLNFGIYCGMSRQFRETFKELFMKVCNETKGIMIVRVTHYMSNRSQRVPSPGTTTTAAAPTNNAPATMTAVTAGEGNGNGNPRSATVLGVSPIKTANGNTIVSPAAVHQVMTTKSIA